MTLSVLHPTFPHIELAGDQALIVYLGDQIQPQLAAQVQAANSVIKKICGQYLVDTIPSYASVLVIYDALAIDYDAIKTLIQHALAQQLHDQNHSVTSRLITLRVYYSEQTGPDLTRIATLKDLSLAQVIELHQQAQYRVYAIGFAPGFAYLGEVDARIAMPRLATPRAAVPKGAVGIADQQTAVYPAASPGGWNIIGRCPVDLFNPHAQPIMPVAVGDRVKFKSIDQDEFLALGGEL